MFPDIRRFTKNILVIIKLLLFLFTQVSKITRFAQFYLLSSLPALMPKQGAQHDEIFMGVGRGSLAKGDEGRDYRGHIFWDSEVYVLPAVVLFHPTLAKVRRNSLRCRAYIFPVVKNVPVDVSAHAQ